jgi:hypothetical protein
MTIKSQTLDILIVDDEVDDYWEMCFSKVEPHLSSAFPDKQIKVKKAYYFDDFAQIISEPGHTFDLLVLDCNLGGTVPDGRDCARLARKQLSTKRAYFIGFSTQWKRFADDYGQYFSPGNLVCDKDTDELMRGLDEFIAYYKAKDKS